MALGQVFLVVAIVLFVIDGFMWWMPNAPWTSRLTPLGLAFFAAHVLVT
jgi:hypothetical protein